MKRSEQWESGEVKPISRFWTVLSYEDASFRYLPGSNTIEAQERRFIYGETARTPCVADFEDFLELAYRSNPLYDGDFLPVWDLDGTIAFSDFVLFTPDFGKRICIDLHDLATVSSIEATGVDGVPGKTTRIRMSVPSGIRNLGGTGESNAISVSLRVVDLVTGQHTLREVKTRSAQSLSNITVEELISNGSTLGVDSWAFALARSYRTPSGSLTLSTELTPEWATLALRPFQPMDVNLFSLGSYPGGASLEPATGPEPNEDGVREALKSFLVKRLMGSEAADSLLNRAMEIFDGEAVSRIPNPNLRAGLVSLIGTLAEGAIPVILGSSTQSVDFGAIGTGDYTEV